MSNSQNQAIQLLASPLPALSAVTHTLPPPAGPARAIGSRHAARARRRNACAAATARLRTGSRSQLALAPTGPVCAPEPARCRCHTPCLAVRSCNWAHAHTQPAQTAPTCARTPPIHSIMHVPARQPAHRVCIAYAPRCVSRMRAHPWQQ
ncbi:hypothetical protein BD626DRAFT_506561 [Schizophyllum amplum]|uniref:Uncharacterized protein n=1 Tax=Schizophyllum amplum TaxID=97359 RepID=A0A550C4X9_9AGAR|nr:hypothetical protein BD626DRAFT_506561 [Auriculariopsis ampla]